MTSQGLRDLLGLQGFRGHRVSKGCPGRRPTQVQRVQQGLRERRGWQAQQGQRVLQVLRGRRELQVLRVSQGRP